MKTNANIKWIIYLLCLNFLCGLFLGLSIAYAQSTLCGDVNDDFKITGTDALAVLKTSIGIDVGLICNDPLTVLCGDVNADGRVSVLDALLILKVSVGQPVELLCHPPTISECTKKFLLDNTGTHRVEIKCKIEPPIQNPNIFIVGPLPE